MSATDDTSMSPLDDLDREMQALELALLRAGVDERVADRDRCSRCDRTPLIGEHVYRYDEHTVICELCRPLEAGAAVVPQLVHGPAFGHTIRIIDQRAA